MFVHPVSCIIQWHPSHMGRKPFVLANTPTSDSDRWRQGIVLRQLYLAPCLHTCTACTQALLPDGCHVCAVLCCAGCQVAALVFGTEASALEEPKGYRGKYTLTMRSTKVHMGVHRAAHQHALCHRCRATNVSGAIPLEMHSRLSVWHPSWLELEQADVIFPKLQCVCVCCLWT